MPASAPATPAKRSSFFRLVAGELWRNAASHEQDLPLLDSVGHAAMNFEPGQRFTKDAAVRE